MEVFRLAKYNTSASSTGSFRYDLQDEVPLSPAHHSTSRLQLDIEEQEYNHGTGINKNKQNTLFASKSEKANKVSRSRKIRCCSWSRPYSVWLWPSICLSISFGCFAAIIVILAVYDHSSVPDLRFGITLNALVSILATVGTAMMAACISEAMGQKKWNRFRKAMPLADFHIIDQASRGPAGSLVLLAKRRGGLLTTIGACLFILIFAINPFVQQLVRYRDEIIISGYAAVPITVAYGDSDGDTPVVAPDLSVKAALYNGLFNSDTTSFNITPVCSSGSCSWNTYQTLGICSTCSNITKYVTTSFEYSDEDPVRNLSLSNGLKMSDDTGPEYRGVPNIMKITVSNTFQGYSSLAFRDRGSILLDIFALFHDSTALECMLQFCVKNLTAKEVNGTFMETELGWWTNNTVAGVAWSNVSVNDTVFFGYDQEKTLDLSLPDGVTYSIGAYFQAQMATWLGALFVGSVWAVGESDQLTFTNDVAQAIWKPMDGGNYSRVLNSLMENVAASLTVNMRSGLNGNLSAPGVATSSVTLVHISWLWMIFPLFLATTALLLLIAVMVETRRRRMQVWGNNALATMFHGLEQDTRGSLGTLYEVNDMALAAEELKVILDAGDNGWQLARHR